MAGDKMRGPATYAKVATLVVGVILLGVGLHSFFQSSWYKKSDTSFLQLPIDVGVIPIHEACQKGKDFADSILPGLGSDNLNCPPIAMEQYFVSIVIITFILSVLVFVGGFVLDMTSGPLKMVDAGYHGIAAVLIFIGGIVYIVSAKQISDDFGLGELTDLEKDIMKRFGINFRTSEKYAAGALALIQSIIYGAVAFLVARS